ncbi:glutamate carboxypeptidase Tre2 [Ophiocordyceps camponoti-floridani]|uniref:Glutamate carboxypeptidase Tre2 n=1 Tax=Ophiocordyceps camponoti-floridani TaxID=2030778 RepID=A0A8H4VC96_9HYPO|nr:glutamate carboxypeptidase Tre2 [Ophiocordyceps camponoti-floridani]
MAPEKQPFYHPSPPSYDQALAGSSRGASNVAYDDDDDIESLSARYASSQRLSHDEHVPSSPIAESQQLLSVSQPRASSSAVLIRNNGYRPPTVETDDEESLAGGFGGHREDDDSDDDDDDDAATVRREIEQMDLDEPPSTRGSSWPKMLPGFSLPSWTWPWPRLPELSRLRQRMAAAFENNQNQDEDAPRRRWPFNLDEEDKRRLCQVCIRFIVALVVLTFVVLYVTTTMDVRYRRFDPQDLRQHVMTNVEPMRLRASVMHFSNYAHIAGTEGDYATAMDVETMFSRAGLDRIEVDEYRVYVNYPRKDGRAVQIMNEAGSEPVWTAKLDEDEVGGETTGRQTYAFHGLSKSGDVRGPLLYANYGTRDDFAHLRDRGIETRGAIALVRHRRNSVAPSDAGMQVKAAELAGFAGCLIYTDPADDGFLKGDVAPHGRWMPTDAVRRDSVGLRGWMPGDVLTPGWESESKVPRMKVNETTGLVGIPSLPLAWRDAKELLRQLNGHGERVPAGWAGGVPDLSGGWWTGNQTSPVVRLRNEQDEQLQQPIWNVYGKIVGQEQAERAVLVGNHRDSWAFGAGDPHAGTAVMIELARILGGLLARGWRPLRTIEFMSWDGASYNLMGSTEFVEKRTDELREAAYAYVNLDGAVSGTKLRAAGSPALQRPLERAMHHVLDSRANATLAELWRSKGGRLRGLGAGGDYAALQHTAGTSSLDLAFVVDDDDSKGVPVAHSSYDRLALIEDVVDPGFAYHVLLAQLVGVLLLDLADRPVVSFGMKAYADALKEAVSDLDGWIKVRIGDDKKTEREQAVRELVDAAALVGQNAQIFDGWELEWDRQMLETGGRETLELSARRFLYNDRKAAFETALLDLELGGGIPNRTQFKHVVYGPQLWAPSRADIFPAIRDTVEADDWPAARRAVAKAAAVLRKAASVLTMDDGREA